MGNLRVVLSGIYYPVAILRYFQAAFLRRKDVSLYTVGPYTGGTIPWAGGMLVNCPLPKPDLEISTNVPGLEIRTVEGMLQFDFDVWIQIDAAYNLKGRPSHGKHFIVGTDPHCINYDYQRIQADVFFNMQKPYMKGGDVWLPYAYDPIYHAPKAVPLEYDFGIIGADSRQGPLYQPRNELVDRLRKQGYSVLQSFGKAYEDYRDLLAKCKVGLNWSTRLDTTARVFETMGMGLALLTNHTPDLDALGFKNYEEYVGVNDLNEALEKACWLIEFDNWAEVSVLGHDAAKPHTWDARVEKILDYV